MATQAKRFAEGKFANPPHPKDGYPLPECKDPRARRMLEFVLPILYLKKPARVTVRIVYCAMTDPAPSQRHNKIGMMIA